jgi:DNA invertase Pin-like site-specific DNA recombinase
MNTAVGYVRVSTDEQTTENQKLALRNWAESAGYHVLDFFEDQAVSGKVPAVERAGFQQLAYFIAQNPVDAVLVYELSRIGRSMFESLDAIKAIEKYAPLVSCSPREGFLQTTEPSIRKLLLGILTWVSERERDLLVQRTKAGMARARAEGKQVGRPAIEWTPEILAFINAALLDGRSVHGIARDLNISKASLYGGLHDFEIFRWYWSPHLAQSRAGRSSTGLGACSTKERKFAHVDHDVLAIAHTRAKNRAHQPSSPAATRTAR